MPRRTEVGNIISTVIAACGGVAATAKLATASEMTVYGYERMGKVLRADVCLALAEAAAPKLERDVLDLANELAGRKAAAKRRK